MMLGSSYHMVKTEKPKQSILDSQNGRQSAILNQILTKLELTGKGLILHQCTKYEVPSSCWVPKPKNPKHSILAIQNGHQSAILDPILTKFELTRKGPILYQCTKYEAPWSRCGQVIARRSKKNPQKQYILAIQNGRQSAILNPILTKLELTGKGTILYQSTEYEGPSSCSGQVIARRSPKERKQSILVHQNGRRSAILNPILTKLELTGKGTILYQSNEYEGPSSCSGQVIVRRSPKNRKQSILASQNGRQSAILDPILTKFELTGKGPILYQCTKYEAPR